MVEGTYYYEFRVEGTYCSEFRVEGTYYSEFRVEGSYYSEFRVEETYCLEFRVEGTYYSGVQGRRNVLLQGIWSDVDSTRILTPSTGLNKQIYKNLFYFLFFLHKQKYAVQERKTVSQSFN